MMIQAIKDYFLNVFVRAIVGYMFFIFFLIVIFIGYFLLADLTSAIKFITEFAKDDFGKVVIFLPLFFSLFKADKKGSGKVNVNRGTTDFYLLTHNSRWL